MKSVIVVISTFNGEKHIVRQLDSIFSQIGVNVSVYIRDDNSTDGTIKVVETYKMQHPEYDIIVEKGENIGYAKSFWTALKVCGKADYYAFSDQDDVWKIDKLEKSIAVMDEKKMDEPQLSYCKMIRCDENLNPLEEQVSIFPVCEMTKKIALTKTYNYGAATVINRAARDLVCRVWPNVDDLPHDLWVGMLCFWFGNVHFVDEELYYWIRYNTSVTGEGTKKTSIIYRAKKTLKGRSYVNVSKYLLDNYEYLLDINERAFLEKILNYKHNIKDRMSLVLDKDFCRGNIWGTVTLKLGILFGWY